MIGVNQRKDGCVGFSGMGSICWQIESVLMMSTKAVIIYADDESWYKLSMGIGALECSTADSLCRLTAARQCQ